VPARPGRGRGTRRWLPSTAPAWAGGPKRRGRLGGHPRGCGTGRLGGRGGGGGWRPGDEDLVVVAHVDRGAAGVHLLDPRPVAVVIERGGLGAHRDALQPVLRVPGLLVGHAVFGAAGHVAVAIIAEAAAAAGAGHGVGPRARRGGQGGSRPGGRLPVGWAVLTRPMVGTAYLLAYIYIGESLNDCLQEVSSFSLIQTDPEVI